MARTTDYAAIYRDHADLYDAMVSAEDCDGRLLPALAALAPLDGAQVLDVGIGTGRLARLLAPRCARVVGVDRAPAMLEVARAHLERVAPGRFELHAADATALPVPDGWADLAVAGWTFGHLRYERAAEWRAAIGAAMAEMDRALRPGGTLVVIETLGTGTETPAPPSPELAEYAAWLEGEQGMRRDALRTDYRFADAAAAARATAFFFGEAFAERVRANGWARIPECTGLWSRPARTAR
jgi:ubiquinone/menaquinone biosynthesis C-methylase UbiE